MILASAAHFSLLAAFAATTPPSTLSEAWVTDVQAPVNAAVVVYEDHVYVGNAAGSLSALSVDTGEIAWTFQADAALDGQATVDDDAVFIQSRGGRVHAIDRERGVALWSSAAAEPGPHDFWDFTLAAPVLHGDTVVVGTGSGQLNGYHRQSGELAWQYHADGAIRGTPALVGDTLYFGSFDGRFTALGLVDRQPIWQFKTLGSEYFPDGAIQGAPTIVGDLVHVGSRDYNLYVLDRASGRVMWNLRTPSWVIGGPAVDAKHAYFGTSDSRRIYAVNVRTGDPAWTFDTSSRVFGSPVIHAGIVYFGSFDGRIHGLDAATGEQRHVYRTRGGIENHGLVYAEDGQLAESFRAFARANGQLEAERLMLKVGSIGATPTVAAGKLLFASTDGHVYALALPEAGTGD